MPFTVQNLIDGRPHPVVARVDQSLHAVLTIMLDHGYSQLPVVDGRQQPIGMITSDSVMRALKNLRVSGADLQVADVMTKKPPIYRPEDDIFDLLGALHDQPAVVVVNGTHELIGIVTSWDTMEYFRQRAQDMMYVQEIEDTLKRYLTAAFTRPAGTLDTDARGAAIDAITPSNNDLRGSFQKALMEYLRLCGSADPSLTKPHATAAFDAHLYRKQTPKAWDKLSLDEYITLLLHDQQWPQFAPIFRLDRAALRSLLDSVRVTRNDLAHFRTDITTRQRDELRFCKEWLLRHEEAVVAAFGGDDAIVADLPAAAEQPISLDTPASLPADELAPGDSRYAPLALYLEGVQQDQVQLTFQEIERILGDSLPPSARQWRSWWANDTTSHPHAQEWLTVGWRVARIAMTEERVTFARIKEREQAYIAFYSQLLADLRAQTTIPAANANLDGVSWMAVAPLIYDGVGMGGFNFAFARTRQFRVELYIDSGNYDRNKQFFDALIARRDQIDQDLGATVTWQRLESKRASRVSVAHDVFITAPEAELAALRAWAVEMMARFYAVITQHTQTLHV
jgi:CBS domain-containing protein